MKIILASASPRRKELMENAGVKFEVRVSKADETLDDACWKNPSEAVKKLAERKAHAVVEEVLEQGLTGEVLVIGADTMVVHKNTPLGKPSSKEEARLMLQQLSGDAHEVLTAVSLWMLLAGEGDEFSLGMRTLCDASTVYFRDLSQDEIEAYLLTDEPYDKAGAYAIQGEANAFIRHFEGSFDSIMGLPMNRLLREYPELLA